MFPGIQRDSDEWVSLNKIRTIVERSINHFKTNICHFRNNSELCLIFSSFYSGKLSTSKVKII